MIPQIGGVVYDDEAALYPGADYEAMEGCETEICLAVTEEGNSPKKLNSGASLVAQCLKKKFTCQFRRLGFHPRSRKDPTCLGMNKPERHNY